MTAEHQDQIRCSSRGNCQLKTTTNHVSGATTSVADFGRSIFVLQLLIAVTTVPAANALLYISRPCVQISPSTLPSPYWKISVARGLQIDLSRKEISTCYFDLATQSPPQNHCTISPSRSIAWGGASTRLHARSSSESLQQGTNPPKSKKKKNKYASFSKTDHLSMDPLDTMIHESRDKLRQLNIREKNHKKKSENRQTIEALDELLGKKEEERMQNNEKRERNKRSFPDTKEIDPYDPTTYGYIELGTIIGAHGVHGFLKLSSTTDFSEHRLCQPGIRHIKPPNRRSPRQVRLAEGRPLRIENAENPTYLIRLEHVSDRESALKLRGCVLYSLEEERADEWLEENEYIVSDLVGLDVYLEEEAAKEMNKTNSKPASREKQFFVGNVRGVVMGSEMCAVPGLGQDLMEVTLSRHRRRTDRLSRQPEEMVLIPFVPQIVSRVNLVERSVYISPPKGLLDLSYVREEKVKIRGFLPPARDD